jgi:hypothetical protein
MAWNRPWRSASAVEAGRRPVVTPPSVPRAPRSLGLQARGPPSFNDPAVPHVRVQAIGQRSAARTRRAAVHREVTWTRGSYVDLQSSRWTYWTHTTSCRRSHILATAFDNVSTEVAFLSAPVSHQCDSVPALIAPDRGGPHPPPDGSKIDQRCATCSPDASPSQGDS